MKEKELSGEESLRLINRMIYEAKGYFYESGTAALIYGFSVLICALLAYLREKEFISLPFSPFYAMVPVFFLQAWIQFKENEKKKAKTFTDEAIDFVWVGFFLSVIIALAGIFAGAGYIIITIILFLTGLATFLTGMIAKFLYHIVCGIVCLVIAAISFFIQNANIYLVLAAVAAIVWIIPGFMLRVHFKKQEHE
jgi:hypothetical protein